MLSYSITGQRHTTIIGDNGQLQEVMEVTFKTSTGVVSHVDIPLDQYTKDNVQSAVEARVSAIADVSTLGTSS